MRRSHRAWQDDSDEMDEDEASEFGGTGPRRRAVLRESEAEELKRRLDDLLAELGRHRRFEPAEFFRRPAVITTLALVAVMTTVALMSWRHYRHAVG